MYHPVLDRAGVGAGGGVVVPGPNTTEERLHWGVVGAVDAGTPGTPPGIGSGIVSAGMTICERRYVWFRRRS